MKPVICFFETGNYIYSEKYELNTCLPQESVTEFLSRIEEAHAEKMKIVQINFEANHLASAKPKLYENWKAAVFVLNDYSIIQESELFVETSESIPGNFQLLFSKLDFIRKINAIKDMIAAGRIYQVNMTCALQAKISVDAFQFFKDHAKKYSGNYKCFLPLKDYSIISFSPELFLKKKNSKLKTSPIKGSIKKAMNSEAEIMASEKEQAELSMIVDLLRNDLNSLENSNSAVVTKHREIMNLNYIQHTYSEIEIETDLHLPKILEKMMPGGSISGCPKKESLQVIYELESFQRSAYTGTMGWWKENDFELNIAIRTFVQSNQDYFYFSGGGIVYDSDPEKEFAELISKTGRLHVQYE